MSYHLPNPHSRAHLNLYLLWYDTPFDPQTGSYCVKVGQLVTHLSNSIEDVRDVVVSVKSTPLTISICLEYTKMVWQKIT